MAKCPRTAHKPDNGTELIPWATLGSVRRYSQQQLPKMRYLPGIGVRPADQDVPHEEAFAFGIDLYNHACWWEAHEIWESVWLDQVPQSLERLAMALLINAANLNLKIVLAKPNAARRLAGEIKERFDEWSRRGGRTVFEVDVTAWYVGYRAYIENLLIQTRPTHSSKDFPFLTFNQSKPSTKK